MCEKNGRARAFARSLPASECGGPRHGGQQEDRLSACRADCRRTGLAGPMGIGRLIVVVGVVDAPAASGMNASVLVAPAAPSSASVTSDIVASSAPALSAVRAAAACAAAISSANASSAFSFAAFCCSWAPSMHCLHLASLNRTFWLLENSAPSASFAPHTQHAAGRASISARSAAFLARSRSRAARSACSTRMWAIACCTAAGSVS
mmetsp:Transcript_17138/g.43101  ORF Transcript_17138/g.43101 Transcript_17138/m.43101 type:complete len:207 (-) Transcript_17138:75-695(-)